MALEAMVKTVGGKFSLVYIGLVALIVILGLISIFTLSGISRTINGLIKTNYDSITRLAGMRQALWSQNQSMMDYLYTDNAADAIAVFREQEDQFRYYYEKERATIILPQELVYIEEIGSSFREYLTMADLLIQFDLKNPEDYERAARFYREELRPQQLIVEEKMRLLHTSNEIALFSRKEEAAQSAANSIGITGVVFLAAAGGGYFLATQYTRRFLKPLYEITENIKLIREGNLNRDIMIKSQDEFGMLAEEFNNMVRRLSEFERSTLGSLIQERNKSDSLVKSIYEPMLVVDAAGKLLLMNKAFERLYGLTEADSLGAPLPELVPGSGFREYITALRDGETDFHQGKTIVVPVGGEDLFYHVAVTPIPGPEGEISGLIMMLHDVTEMKRLERVRGDFIATISHEFKTPLTSIVMGADLISGGMLGPMTDDQREVVETIKEDSLRLESLVGEIMELSRMESSKTLYQFIPCNLSQIIAASVRQFEPMAERSGVYLGVDCPGNLPQVRADFSKITWVLNNLLSNAMKYTQAGDAVTVAAELKKGYAEVSVTDTGVGVPPEFVEQIFEKYVQIKGYDIEVRGSGLGLAAAREIISAHRGRIWCDPEVEEGSRFVFTLETWVCGDGGQGR